MNLIERIRKLPVTKHQRKHVLQIADEVDQLKAELEATKKVAFDVFARNKQIADLEVELAEVVSFAKALDQGNDNLKAKNERLWVAVGFFASGIKSGESWSDACQERLDALKEVE